MLGAGAAQAQTDSTPPTLSSAAVNGHTAVLTFDEALDESVTIGDPVPFFNQIGGSATNATNATVSGRTVTLTFPSSGRARHGQTVNVWYSAPSAAARQFRDLAGNRLATTNAGDWTVTNNTPPAFSSAAVNGATLEVTFDGALDPNSVPAASAFTVAATRSGSALSVALADSNPVAVSGSAVTLTLAEAVLDTDTVTVAYAEPETGKLRDSDNALLSVTGFDDTKTVTNNTPEDETPPTLSSAAVNGQTVTLVFSEALDESVSIGDPVPFFQQIVGGSLTIATGAEVDGRTVTLTFPPNGRVRHGQTVNVWYSAPPAAARQFRDLSGNRLATTNAGDWTVTNNTPGTSIPAAPAAPTVSKPLTPGITSISVRWEAPANTELAVTDYDVRYRRKGDAAWTEHDHTGTAASATISNVLEGASWEAQVRATNSVGTGPWSEAGAGHTGPARFVRAEVEAGAGNVISFYHTKRFTSDGLPAGRFTFAVNGGAAEHFIAAGTDGPYVWLSIGSTGRIRAGDTVTLSYSAADHLALGKVLDADGLAIRSFSNKPVTNTVPGAAVTAPAAPATPTVTAASGSASSLSVIWAAPSTGGSAITDYDVRYHAGSTDPTDEAAWVEEHESTGNTNTLSTAVTRTITGLAPGTAHRVQVRARNGNGVGAWSASGTATTNTASGTNQAPVRMRLANNPANGCVTKTADTSLGSLNVPAGELASIGAPVGTSSCTGSSRAAPFFNDPDGDTLTYAARVPSLADNVYLYSLIPIVNVTGTNQLKVWMQGAAAYRRTAVRVDIIATDPHGASVSTWFVAQVGHIPDTNGAPSLAAAAGLAFAFAKDEAITPVVLPAATGGDVRHTSSDGESAEFPYAYAVTGLPAGLSFDEETREIKGTPTAAGVFTVTYTAKDADNVGTPTDTGEAGKLDTARATFTVAVAAGVGAGAGEPPKINRVRVVSLPTYDSDSDGLTDTYVRGDRILVDVEYGGPGAFGGAMSLAIGGNKTVRLRLDVGGAVRTLQNPTLLYHDETLRFAYTVQASDTDTDGVQVKAGESNKVLFLVGNTTLTHAENGVAADLTFGDLPATGYARAKVDGTKSATDIGPRPESATVNGDTLTVTFDGNLDTALDAGDRQALREYFFVRNAGFNHHIRGLQQHPQTVAVSDATVTLTLGVAITAGEENIRLSYVPPAGGGVLRGDGTSGKTVPRFRGLEVTNATAGTEGPAPLYGNVKGRTLRLVFDGALDESSLPAGSAFEVSVVDGDDDSRYIDGTGTAAIDGRFVEVTLARAVRADESAVVSYTKPASNPLKAPGAGGAAVISFDSFKAVGVSDAAAPALLGGTVVQTGTSPDRSKMALWFDETLDAVSTPESGDFAVREGENAAAVSGVAVAGSNVVLTLDTLAANGTVFTVAYTPGTNPIRDVSGNPAAAFRQTVTAAASGAPALQSAVVDGGRLTLTYDKPLDPESRPAPATFEFDQPVTGPEGEHDRGPYIAGGVFTVAVQGRKAVLTLEHPVHPCDKATPFVVSYGSPRTPTVPVVKSFDGSNSLALKYQAVTNARAGWCEVGWFDSSRIGSVIVRSKRPYATDIEPQAAWFTVRASGGPVTVTGAAFSTDDAHELKLTLDRELGPHETVTVSYTRPEGAEGLWDVTGRQLADIADRPVANAPAAAEPARFESAAMEPAGRGLILTFTKDILISGRHTDYTVLVDGTLREIVRAFWEDNTVGLVLAQPVRSGETVTVAYAKPASGTMLHDADELTIDSFGPEAVTNPFAEAPAAPAPPALAQASETGVTLTWAAPDNADQAPVNGYGVRYRQHGAADWARHAHTGTGTSATIEALAPGHRFEAQVRATGPGGDSPWSDSGWGHTGPARLVSAVAPDHGRGVTLTFTKDISIGAGHPNYDVVVDGESRALHGAGWVDNAVYLALEPPLWSGQGVTVRYTPPEAYAVLEDADGLAVAGFGPVAVDNASTVAPPLPPLTASFAGLPARHDGSSRFTFELHFSEDFGGRLDYRVLRDEALQAEGGRVTNARRLAQYANRAWSIEVRPWSAEDVTVTLAATTDCAADGAVCTPDGRPLSNSVTATVAGPPRNTPATGAPTIAGTAQAGETLSASSAGIADADGMTGARFAWQWVSSDGSSDTDIAGATAASYTLADADVGKRIKVRVAFTDDRGHAEALTSAPTAAVVHRPLLASFVGVPAEHDGKKLFSFELVFSDNFGGRFDYKALRDRALQASGGRVVDAKRLAAGRNDRWTISVRPASYEAVTVTLPAGSVVTESGRTLANTLTATVTGPALLSVADARGEEGVDAAITFAVSLSRAASGPVTVDYVTLDGTAVAGEDYTRTRGTLTFAPGETQKTVVVPILDDAIDEGEETFTLKLRNAQGAWLLDGEATGTIENDDPMPKAWTARFGRTVAVHVVDAVEARLEGASESWVQVGGHRLGGPAADVHETVRRLAPERDLWAEAEAADPAGQTRTFRDLLLGSAFHLASNGEDAASGPRLSAWGRVATSGFDGVEDKVSLDGTVTTATLGVDGVWKRWLTGLVLAYSEGDGSFTHTDMPGGDLTSSLTSLHPYVSYTLNDRVRLWGVVGYGSGALRLSLADQAPMDTDLTMSMGAVGVRGTLLQPSQPGGLELALRSDVLWMGMDSAAAHNLAATQAEASRLRLVLEGSRPVALAGGGSFTPSLEVGLRHDGGDAETGTGVEVGGRLRYASAWGLSIEASVRTLLAHEAADYTEWGASGALRFDPGRQGKGFTASITPTWGAAASGTSRLWDQQGATGLVPADALAPTAAGRLDAELGYGVATLRGRGLLTPYARVALTEGADQAWHLGTRLALAESLNFSLEASRRQRDGDVAAHELALRANLGF